MQLQAVKAPLGPVLVLAGAGSGKTRVLTSRIAYLIRTGQIPADNILALTFTNKAAKEMTGRVAKLLGSKYAKGPTMGTFHSVCARILRKEIARIGYSNDFVIVDSADQLKIIKEILNELSINKKFGAPLFRSYISSAKNLLQTPGQMSLGLDGAMAEMAQQVYSEYQNFLIKQNSVDFDDLLMLPIKIFEISPETLSKYQQKFAYILVDEYQDTNPAQYTLLRMLGQHKNLFVVGDDAQSIYGFRGSDIRNILGFEKDFPKSQVYKLEQNYRSTKNILEGAQKVIGLNSDQKPKTLWTENNQGEKIIVRECADGHEEAVYVAKQIISMSSDNELVYEEEVEHQTTSNSILDRYLNSKAARRSGLSSFNQTLPVDHDNLSEYAILYRTNAQSRELEEVLIRANIPYQIVGGTRFYDRKEIKDVLGYLRLTYNFHDLVSIKRVINEPPRGIGPKSYSIIKQFMFLNDKAELPEMINQMSDLGLSSKATASVQKFFAQIAHWRSLSEEAHLSDVLKTILKDTGYEKNLKDGTPTGEARAENVSELFNVVTKWDHVSWQEALPEFLEEVALITDLDTVEDKKDAVTLMTLHAAKGLEFDTVFFVGLEEGLLPHSQSLLDPTQLAEEIRLAYVGLTRAQKNLFLLYARSRQVYGSTQVSSPSRILEVLTGEGIDRTSTSPSYSSGGKWNSSSDDLTYEPFWE